VCFSENLSKKLEIFRVSVKGIQPRQKKSVLT